MKVSVGTVMGGATLGGEDRLSTGPPGATAAGGGGGGGGGEEEVL